MCQSKKQSGLKVLKMNKNTDSHKFFPPAVRGREGSRTAKNSSVVSPHVLSKFKKKQNKNGVDARIALNSHQAWGEGGRGEDVLC